MKPSLYFCCKLTDSTVFQTDSNFFYPVTYPQNYVAKKNKAEILLESLSSLSKINFDFAFFYIELSDEFICYTQAIHSLLSSSIKANSLLIEFSRPSTLLEWKKQAASVRQQISDKSPLLVIMNHDHIFVEYNPSSFINTIQQVFSDDLDIGRRKVLSYSHAPEFISKALLHSQSIKCENLPNLYRIPIPCDWIDSLYVMTAETLCYIWDSVICHDDYMGRFDWPGNFFGKLELTGYVYTREFFRHYDGYSHVTGIRLFSQPGINISTIDFNSAKSSPDADQFILFYYQRFLDCYLLYIRNSLVNNTFSFKSKSLLFRAALRLAINSFITSVILPDTIYFGYSESSEITCNFTSKVYYNANLIYASVCDDLDLLNHSRFGLRAFLRLYLRRVLKSLNLYYFFRKFLKYGQLFRSLKTP